jgi:hypothetical protein
MEGMSWPDPWDAYMPEERSAREVPELPEQIGKNAGTGHHIPQGLLTAKQYIDGSRPGDDATSAMSLRGAKEGHEHDLQSAGLIRKYDELPR